MNVPELRSPQDPGGRLSFDRRLPWSLSLWVCISVCLVSVLTKKNYFSVCSPTRAMSLIINFVPTFTVSASVINAFFTGGKDPGESNS